MADTLNNKQFLDRDGLTALWTRIKDTFAPRWVSYKPSSSSTIHNGSAIESTDVNALQDTNEVYIINTAAGQLRDKQTGTVQYGEDIIVHIPAAVGGDTPKAGVMSASDKVKLDGIESTAESAVTLKNILVGGGDSNAAAQKLKINQTQTDPTKDDYKAVAFGLNYNAATDILSIVDLNNNKTALSSVHILGDALKDAFISDASMIIDEDGKSKLKIVFLVKAQQDGDEYTEKPVIIDMSDLVDVYSAGNGITITPTDVDPDDNTERKSTITLNRAGVGSGADKIGGIKVYKDLGTNGAAVAAKTSSVTYTAATNGNRFLGVELDKNGQAYVYNPVEEVAKATANAADGGTIAHEGEFTVITSVGISSDENSGKITVTENPTKYKLPAETKLAKGTDTTVNPAITPLKFGSTFTAQVGTSVSDHTITDKKTTWTLPSLSTPTVGEAGNPGTLNYGDATNHNKITAAPVVTPTAAGAYAFSIPVVKSLTVGVTDTGQVSVTTTQDQANYWVDVESIPTSVISALEFPLS